MRLAGEGGFEPPNVGSKDRCLTTWRLPNDLNSVAAGAPTPNLRKRSIMPLLRRGRDRRRRPLVAIGVEVHQAMVNLLGDFLPVAAGHHQGTIFVVAEVADLEEKTGGNEVVANDRGNPFATLAHDVVAHRMKRMHLQALGLNGVDDRFREIA